MEGDSLSLQGALAGDLARVAGGMAAKAAADRGAAEDAANLFEELFASVLVKEMRGTLTDGFFAGGAGSDVFEGWLDEHLGRALAEGRGLGIRAAVLRDLAQKQSADAVQPKGTGGA